ncbi:WD repeat-containing protein 20-like [Watersipora subatra]|uniref:WD repeat-containing protein 20-like n=1 Tax=Watersipora subatra TaxID=2589382 RepID=UPI00355C0C08
MAMESGGNKLDEVKTQFAAREGIYKLSSLSEYSRPTRVNYPETGNSSVAVSFTPLDEGLETPTRICFNIGKELYVYPFKGLKKAADLTQPTDKRIYKGTFPTCHSFSQVSTRESGEDDPLLLIGFSAGQIQMIDPVRARTNQLYNSERVIDKTKVTCVSWLPGNDVQFLVSHASGSLYIYSQDSQCPPVAPSYQVFKQGESHTIYTCKTKTTRNPMFKWMIGDGAIYQFEFSPCKQYLAIVSQDGFLRVFDFHRMDMVGYMKSYFGGLHCVSWSPDGKYIATGGEDDLITVYSFHENRVICRGRGHRSWATSIAFDPYTSSGGTADSKDYTSDDESLGRTPLSSKCSLRDSTRSSTSSRLSIRLDGDGNTIPLTTYRIGSVSQDTNICLWDITSDVLNSHITKNRTSSYIAKNSALEINTSVATPAPPLTSLGNSRSNSIHPVNSGTSTSAPNLSSALPSPQPSIGNGTKVKRNFTLGHRDKNSVRAVTTAAQTMRHKLDLQNRLLGTQYCPRLNEVALLEPLTCKKLSHNMLTSIHFFKDYLVISSQDGVISCFARPHKQLFEPSSQSHDSFDTSQQITSHASSKPHPSQLLNGHDSHLSNSGLPNGPQW